MSRVCNVALDKKELVHNYNELGDDTMNADSLRISES